MKNFQDIKRQLQEKHLTAAEKKKREEIAQAIEKKNPDMPMEKKMAIATAQAKKVAEDYEKFMSEINELGITEEMIIEKGLLDNILGFGWKYGSKLFGKGKAAETGAKSAEDILKGTPTPATPRPPAADDPMGVLGPKVTKPFKDTEGAKEFTARELERIQKAVGSSKSVDDFRAPSTAPKAVDDIPGPPPAAPKKPTQPRDAGGRFVAKQADDIKPPPGAGRTAVTTGAKAADDIKPPPGASRGFSTTDKVIGGGLAAGAAALAADSMLSGDKSSAEAPKPVKMPEPNFPKPDLPPVKMPEPPKAAEPPKEDKPNYDNMTFGQAFAAARKAAAEKGAQSTGRFEYKGKEYQTNVKGEKYVSRAKQTAVGESFDKLPAGSIDEAILMSLTKIENK